MEKSKKRILLFLLLYEHISSIWFATSWNVEINGNIYTESIFDNELEKNNNKIISMITYNNNSYKKVKLNKPNKFIMIKKD